MSMMASEERRTRKWVWGCTGGCLGFIVIIAVVVGVGIWLLVRPTPLVPAETFVTPQASAFLIARVDPADQLMTRIPAAVLARPEISRLLPTQSGEPLELTEEQALQTMKGFSPMWLVLVVEPSEQQRALHGGVAFALQRYSKLLRLAAGHRLHKSGDARDYKEATIASLGERTYAGVRGNNFMTADSEELLRRWVDRIVAARARAEHQDEPAQPGLEVQEELKRAVERLETDQPIIFACLNAHGELAALAEALPDAELREHLRAAHIFGPHVSSLAFQIRPATSRDGRLTAFIECRDTSSAAQVRDVIQQLLAEAGEEAALSDTTLNLEETVVSLDALITDIPGHVAEFAVRFAEQMQKATEPAQGAQAAPEAADGADYEVPSATPVN